MQIDALLVMDAEHRAPLVEQLEECGVKVVLACNCRQADEVLAADLPVEVVLTAEVLSDGNWFDVLNRVARARTRTQVIVCTRLDDTRLWCEVIQRGAFDLLAEPYPKREVQRIVHSAARYSEFRHPTECAGPPATTAAA